MSDENEVTAEMLEPLRDARMKALLPILDFIENNIPESAQRFSIIIEYDDGSHLLAGSHRA